MDTKTVSGRRGKASQYKSKASSFRSVVIFMFIIGVFLKLLVAWDVLIIISWLEDLPLLD